MKRIVIFFMLFMGWLTAFSQTESNQLESSIDIIDPTPQMANPALIEQPTPYLQHQTPDTYHPAYEQNDMHLPSLDTYGHVHPFSLTPYWYGRWNNWQLHSGLNVSIGASVSAQFGKHARNGVGFGQSISAMYAMPLSNKASLAVGGYFNNLSWGRDNFREAGLSAVFGYQFDEHWEAYIYAQKSLTNNQHAPLPLYSNMYSLGGLQNGWGDRIGAAVRYNFNPSFSIEVSLEKQWQPNPDNLYFGRYNYPEPR